MMVACLQKTLMPSSVRGRHLPRRGSLTVLVMMAAPSLSYLVSLRCETELSAASAAVGETRMMSLSLGHQRRLPWKGSKMAWEEQKLSPTVDGQWIAARRPLADEESQRGASAPSDE